MACPQSSLKELLLNQPSSKLLVLDDDHVSSLERVLLELK